MNTVTVGQTITTSKNKEYQILDPCPLGRGGFGITFKAKELHTKQTCVIKQFKPLSNSQQVWQIGMNLFNREAEKLGKLEHNQIPKLIDYFEQEGEYYLVQEYIEGHDLTEEITQGIKDEEYVTRLLKDILEVLSFLHNNKLIHRDLKPSNIRRRKNDNKIVLIDFGSVKETISESQIGNNNQYPHTGVYSPGYSPIEQKSGQVSFSSDIYALGVIAIQALTGQPINSPIFIHPSGDGLSNQPNETLDWRRHARNISQPLSDIIDKMVMIKHTKRYQKAQEALEALEAIRSILPSSSPQPPIPPIDPTTVLDGKYLKHGTIVISAIGISIITVILLIDPIRNAISRLFNPPLTLNKKYAENNIEIAYSDQWDYKPQSFDTHLVEFIPKHSQSNCTSEISISRQELATPLSVEEYKRKVQEQIKNNNKTEIKDETKGNTLLSKKSAYKLSYTMKENQCEFQILETGTVHDSKGYYISYKSEKGEYEKHLPTLQAMIDTFNIK